MYVGHSKPSLVRYDGVKSESWNFTHLLLNMSFVYNRYARVQFFTIAPWTSIDLWISMRGSYGASWTWIPNFRNHVLWFPYKVSQFKLDTNGGRQWITDLFLTRSSTTIRCLIPMTSSFELPKEHPCPSYFNVISRSQKCNWKRSLIEKGHC